MKKNKYEILLFEIAAILELKNTEILLKTHEIDRLKEKLCEAERRAAEAAPE